MEGGKIPSRDNLSQLHPDLLWGILKNLPVRDLVTTSFLSRSWRQRWTTIPFLIFNGSPMKTVVKTLNHHRGTLRQLVVRCSMDAVLSRPLYLIQLMLLIQRKEIQEVTLELPSVAKDLQMPLIFCFRSLTSLRLRCCTIGKAPFYFEGFHRLKNLDLSLVTFPRETVDIILCKSPIQRLRMCDCSGFSHLVLNAPSLRSLIFHGTQCLSFHYTPQLDKVYMNISHPPDLVYDRNTKRLDQMLGGLLNCQELYAQGRSMQIMSECIIPERLTITSLRHLKVTMNFLNANHVTALLCLARSSVHLQTLVIRSFCFIYRKLSRKMPHAETTFPHLQSCELSGFRATVEEMKFIKLLLTNAPKLKLLAINWSSPVLHDFRVTTTIYNIITVSEEVYITFQSQFTEPPSNPEWDSP